MLNRFRPNKPGLIKINRVDKCNNDRHKTLELVCNNTGLLCSNLSVPGLECKACVPCVSY